MKAGYARQLAAAITLAIVLAGCVQPAHVGAAIGSIVTPGNTQVPLPPGEWRQMAIVRHSGGSGAYGGTTNTHHVNASYALVENGRLKSLVNVFTSADAPTRYAPNPACLRDSFPEKTYLHEVDGGMINNTDCVKVEKIIAFNPPNAGSTPLYRDLYQEAVELGGLPRSAIRVSFDDALGFHSLDYFIYFFPERDGVQGNSWLVGEEGPAEKAYVSGIVSWTRTFRPAIHNGTLDLLQ